MKKSTKEKKQLRKEAKTKNHSSELANSTNFPANQDQLTFFLGDYFLKMMDEIPHALYFINAHDFTVTFAGQKSSPTKPPKKKTCFNLIYNEKKQCAGKDHPCILDAVKETKKLVMLEHVHSKKGEKRYYRVFGYPILNNDGNVTHVIEYPLEITEQKHAEEKAEINLAKYKNIFNATTDGLVVIDFEDNIKDANPQLCEMFGYTYDEMVQMKGKELAPPEFHHSFKNISIEIQAKGEFSIESVGKRKNGSTFPLEVKGTTFIDQAKAQMLGIMRDITERKRAEEEIILSQVQYRNIFNAVNDGLLIVDLGDKIADANPQLCKMFGYTYDEVLQLRGMDLATQESYHRFKSVRSDIQKTGRFHVTAAGKRKDGSTFDMEVFGANFVTEGKKQMLGVFRDITERKNFEKALQSREEDLLKKTQNAEEANAALKVLLQSIEEERKDLEEKVVGNFKEMIFPYFETLMETDLSPKQEACLKIIESNLKKIASPFLDKLKLYGLSPAEMKVLNFIKEGKRTKEIAEIMGLSKRTIDFYRYNIRKKLKITNNLPLSTYLMDLK
jgi:PAS domain S-box-containing protein